MAIRWTNVAAPDPLPVLPDRDGLLDVIVDPETKRDVLSHLLAKPVEQGGLLIGRAWRAGTVERPGDVTLVQVSRAIAASDATGDAFSLRMESSVWSAARQTLRPGELIIGWYHSHPGLTAFFSETDRQTQRAFFNHDYSLGWVIDPLNGEEAMFLGPDCRPVSRSGT
jgi:proteasome lid subunit RPN8/RPN11